MSKPLSYATPPCRITPPRAFLWGATILVLACTLALILATLPPFGNPNPPRLLAIALRGTSSLALLFALLTGGVHIWRGQATPSTYIALALAALLGNLNEYLLEPPETPFLP